MSESSEQDAFPSTPVGWAGGDRPSHLGYVAHEIRNPLSTALWTSELMARLTPAERGGERGDRLASICLRSLGRIRLLVEDHLLCERLEAGGYPLRLEPIPLAEILLAVAARRPTGDAPLTLPPDGALAARADRTLLERALDALIAVAAEGEAAVRVEAALAAGRLEILVVGAPPLSIGDPTKGSPSEQRGRSLALPMARRVAAALGGSLEVAGEGYLLAIPAA